MDIQSVTQPVIVTREASAKDVSEIIKAADSSKRSLSAIEYSESTPTFQLMPEHIAAAAAVAMAGAAFIVYSVWASVRWAVGAAMLVGLAVALYMFLTAVYRLNKTRHYLVQYEQASTERRLLKVEVKRSANHLSYVDLPPWLAEEQLVTLAAWARNKRQFAFNRETLSRANICTYRQFPELKDAFLKADLVTQDGGGYALTDSFFTLADQLQEQSGE